LLYQISTFGSFFPEFGLAQSHSAEIAIGDGEVRRFEELVRVCLREIPDRIRAYLAASTIWIFKTPAVWLAGTLNPYPS
jgi:hypothetical protein